MLFRSKALEESERWIRVVTDHVPALIAYVGSDMRVQFCNKVYEAWYGRGGVPVLEQRLDQIHSSEFYQRLLPQIMEVMDGHNVTFELEETGENGEVRYMLRSYVPNLDEFGDIIGFFVLIRDITDRRKTALALEQAYDNLERRVKERTAALTGLNSQLRQEITERAAVEARLRDAKLEAERANLERICSMLSLICRLPLACSLVLCLPWAAISRIDSAPSASWRAPEVCWLMAEAICWSMAATWFIESVTWRLPRDCSSVALTIPFTCSIAFRVLLRIFSRAVLESLERLTSS